jgi:hypothetical protein
MRGRTELQHADFSASMIIFSWDQLSASGGVVTQCRQNTGESNGFIILPDFISHIVASKYLYISFHCHYSLLVLRWRASIAAEYEYSAVALHAAILNLCSTGEKKTDGYMAQAGGSKFRRTTFWGVSDNYPTLPWRRYAFWVSLTNPSHAAIAVNPNQSTISPNGRVVTNKAVAATPVVISLSLQARTSKVAGQFLWW